MDTNQQPKAAYLAQELKAGEWSPNILQNEVALRQCAAEELLRQHAEIETLRAGYDAAECSDRKVVKLDARIKELEAQLDAEGAVGMEPLRKTNAAARGTPAADAPTTAAALSRASDLLSSTIGILMGQRAKIAYTDNSPVAALVNEAVEFLRPWPEQLPSSAGAPVVLPEPDAVLRFERSTAGKENEMPIVVSCNWLPDGEYKLYTEQQVRDMLATGWHHRKPNCITCNDHGEVGNIITAEPCPDCTPPHALADVQRDAQRYRWLRKQQWRDGELCVVAQPKKSVKLGSDCKSLDRLDGFIDAARAAQEGK